LLSTGFNVDLMTSTYDINWLREKVKTETLKFLFFWGHQGKNNEEIGKFCFSQWYESPFTVDNITYKTSEHWMMTQKALLFNDTETAAKIIGSNKPGEAKQLGRQIRAFNQSTWTENRYRIVTIGNIHKFNQNPLLGEFLLKTESRILVEASPIDEIWGIGLARDHPDVENIEKWRGLNLLGFALMETRDHLIKLNSLGSQIKI